MCSSTRPSSASKHPLQRQWAAGRTRFRFDEDEAGLTAITRSTAGNAHVLGYGAEWSRTRTEVDAIYLAGNPGRAPVALADSAWSPKVGALVAIAPGITAALQAATGFRAPPYFDVNVGISTLPLGYSVIPNPELRPEKSRGFEAGLAASRGDDRSKGVPLNSIDPPKVVVGLAWEGVAPAPSLVAPAKAGAQFPPSAQLHLTHVAKKTRIDSAAGTLYATPAVTTVDVTAQWRLGAHVTLGAGVFNLFDRKHWLWSDVRGIINPGASVDRYTQPGRNFGAQVKVIF